MKQWVHVIVATFLTGCATVKDVFGVPATPEELTAMSAIEVCSAVGKSQLQNQPQAYLDAKSEARKRIALGQVDPHDCSQFAQMAIRRKEAARDGAEAARRDAEALTK